MARARAFYIDREELQALESDLLEASDRRVGLTVGDGPNQLFIYPTRPQSAGEFTQVVTQVADVRVVVAE
jgi:hypothetical protein